MTFGGLIRRVQRSSGLPYSESKEALILLTEVLAARMDDAARREFASHLPERLADIALTVYPVVLGRDFDITAQFMFYQNIGKKHAQRQIMAAWRVFEDIMGESKKSIEMQLPPLAAVADLS